MTNCSHFIVAKRTLSITYWFFAITFCAMVILFAPSNARAVDFVLRGEYRCELHGDFRQNGGITEASALTSLVTGQGFSFSSGQTSGTKTEMSNPPFIDRRPDYSNTLASGSTQSLATYNGNGFFTLNWQDDATQNPAPSGNCKVQTTAINPSGVIVQFRLACPSHPYFLIGTCSRK